MFQKLKYIIYGDANDLPVNIRIFSIASFAVILIAILQSVVNIVAGNSMAIVFILIGVIPASITFYFARFKQQYYYLSLIFQVCFLLSIDWFDKGGVNGGVFVALISAHFAFYIISPVKYYKYLVLTVLPLFLSLVYIQYAYPTLFNVQQDRDVRFIDLGVSMASLSLAMIAVIYIYKKSYEENKELVETQNHTILDSYNQLKVTEEELRENTEELTVSNEFLDQEKEKAENALKQLQKAKSQLVQSEKMASLGALTAGVAHEINNPVNFISGGNQALRNIISEAMELLELYGKLEDDAVSHEEKEVVKNQLTELKEDIGDLEEFKEDTFAMFDEIQTGVERVTGIVNGLKRFSHSNSETNELVDIHGLLDNSLIILRSKYKNNIEVHKKYLDNLPSVACIAGQISQVFVNIINNAIDATPKKGEIFIETDLLEEEVAITIQDTGLGMPEKVMKQIFDPFYTTKPIGEGTGLGLSISYGIIEAHQGSIRVSSKEGHGTTFEIRLPKQR